QAARLDSIVSCHHHSYERDRLHVSDQWPHAGYRLWPDINCDIGDRTQCALCEALGRGVEMDLRHDRVDRALSQRVRSDRAVVSEGAGVAKTGTDAVRPPFSVTQGVILVAFLILGIMAARRFRPTS